MRNPNGYGSVHKLPGHRRNPWRVRVTDGWDDEGKQLFKTVGYYPNRKTALDALAFYHREPRKFAASTITFKEIYDLVSAERFPKLSDAARRSYSIAYGRSKPLYDMPFAELRKIHLQAIVDACDKSYSTKNNIKVLYSHMYALAMENDIVEKDYSKFLDVGSPSTVSARAVH